MGFFFFLLLESSRNFIAKKTSRNLACIILPSSVATLWPHNTEITPPEEGKDFQMYCRKKDGGAIRNSEQQ